MDWDYGVALEPAVAVKPYSPFVDGQFVDGSGGTLTVVNPATDEPLAQLGAAGPDEVDRAVDAARRAQVGWAGLPGAERARVLFRVARTVGARARELAVLETLDTGRPIRVTRDVDLPDVVAHLQSCAGWTDKLAHAGYGPDPRPVGVAAVVVGAGSLRAAVRRLGPALACGNAVVLSPDPDAPLASLALAEAVGDAGLPAGVLNVLPGAGSALGRHAGVEVAVVTGPAASCREVTVRRGVLEPTGRTAHVVHDDAPLDQVVDGIAEGLGTDQRVLVAESVAAELGELLRERLARLRVGDPLDRNTDVGPVGSRGRYERAVALLAAADDEGAGRFTSPAAVPERGLFLAPTVLTDVAPAMRAARDEVTGPLVPVLTFRTPAEAVALAAEAGAAAVWADKGSRALWTAQQLRAGIVWVNAVGRWDPSAAAGTLRHYLR